MSGFLASAVIPDHTWHLFLAVFAGCYFSDWIAYWLGRLVGAKLYHVAWLHFALHEGRLKKISHFFSKHGLWTLVVGRFIPFGVRNGIFMTAGIGKMHFGKFALIDLSGCLFFSSLLFSCAYYCGRNFETMAHWMHRGNQIIFFSFVGIAIATFAGVWIKKRLAKAQASPAP